MKEEFKYRRKILREKAVSLRNMNDVKQIINTEFLIYSKNFTPSLQIHSVNAAQEK